MQTRIQSLVESAANVAIGCGVALLTQVLVFPLYGMRVTLFQNTQIMLIFTVVSITRSYALRRLFNRSAKK